MEAEQQLVTGPKKKIAASIVSHLPLQGTDAVLEFFQLPEFAKRRENLGTLLHFLLQWLGQGVKQFLAGTEDKRVCVCVRER